MGERRIVKGWIVERLADGSIVPIAPAGQQQMPADPTFPYKGQKAAADVEGTQVNTQGQAIDNRVKSASAPSIIRKAGAEAEGATITNAARIAEMEAKGFRYDPASGNFVRDPGIIPAGTASETMERNGKLARLSALAKQIDRTEFLFNEGAGSTTGVASLKDFNPWSDANAQLDTAGASLAQQGLGAFRVPGTGTVSDRDAIMFDRANLPESSSMDAKTREQMLGLKSRVNEELQGLGQPPLWDETGNPINQGEAPAAPPKIGNAADDIWNQRAPEQQQVAQGSTRNVTSEEQKAIAAELNAMYARGESAKDIAAYAQMRGFSADPGRSFEEDTANYRALQQRNERARPGSTKNWGGPFQAGTKAVPMSMKQRAVGSPGFAALSSAVDATSGGQVISRLARDEMEALRAAHPGSAMVGEVIGSIGGTSALARGSAKLAGKWAPKLLNGGKVGQYGRNLATDVAYGAAYGDATGDGALTGGGAGAIGNTIGGLGGKLFGRLVGGKAQLPASQFLEGQGVTGQTVGQKLGGGVKSIEDWLANSSILGGGINRMRNEVLGQGNNAAYRTVAEGAPIEGVADQALTSLRGVKDKAYKTALDPITIPADDARFAADMDGAWRTGDAVDANRASKDFNLSMDEVQRNLLDGSDVIRGSQAQDALRTLADSQRGFNKASRTGSDVSAKHVAAALGDVELALTKHIGRNAPDALPQLRKANRINRGLAILENASENASENGGVFTAAQLGRAIKANNGKYGGRGFSKLTRLPIGKLQQAMSEILPNNIPPTGQNVAPWLALSGAASAGGGQATGYEGTGLGVGTILALPALLATKAGQKAMVKILVGGDKRLKAGQLLKKAAKKGGTGAIPVIIDQER